MAPEVILEEDSSEQPQNPAFRILYRDEYIVAIDKPAGLLVHRTEEADDSSTCLDMLRDQLGQYVYAAHRLDRKTSGVLLFGLSSEVARALVESFSSRECQKRYLALCRGWLLKEQVVDRVMKFQNRRKQVTEKETRSRIFPLATTECPFEIGPFPTARYSLVTVCPETGRRHQIRRHLNGLGYPIVGDTTYGDVDHNRYFREHLGSWRMFLHALELAFPHPVTKDLVKVGTPPDEEFITHASALGFDVMSASLNPCLSRT